MTCPDSRHPAGCVGFPRGEVDGDFAKRDIEAMYDPPQPYHLGRDPEERFDAVLENPDAVAKSRPPLSVRRPRFNPGRVNGSKSAHEEAP